MRSSNVVFCTLYILASVLGFAGCENMELNPEKVSVESVTLNSTSMEIEVGQSQTLTAVVSPSDAENQKVIWSTSNSAVAIVSDGVVTGVSAGNATITAKSDDGGRTATCEVIVKAAVATVGPATLEMNRITATTASFDGHLNVSENEIPFSAVTLYYSDEETFSIGTAQSVSLTTFGPDQNFSFYLTDLRFDTEYSYSLVVKVKSEETYLDVKKFRTNDITVSLTLDEESLSQWPVKLHGIASGLSEEDKLHIELGVAYSKVQGEAASGQGVEAIIDKINEECRFTVELPEIYHYKIPWFYCYYVKQGDVIKYGGENSFTIETDERESRLLKVSDIGYDTYTLEIKVPEDVVAAGNHVHFNLGSKFLFNYYAKNDASIQTLDDYIMKILSGSKESCDYSCSETRENEWFFSTRVNKQFIVNDEFLEGAYRVEPGEQILICAAVVTPDGEIVGRPEILEFSTKSPSPLNANIQVEITDVSSIDATFHIIPDAAIKEYSYMILSDYDYSTIIECLDDASQLQWFTTSVAAYLRFGASGYCSMHTNQLSNYYLTITPNTKYHLLITGKGDKVGISQCFKHVEFETTSKKRTMPPIIEVTPLPEQSTHFSAAFNVRCTSYDDPASGPAIRVVYNYGYYYDWEANKGDETNIIKGGETLTPDININRSEGDIIQIPVLDGVEMRIGVIGYNDEYDASEPVFATYTSDFYKASPIESDYLTTDILEGDWLMTAIDVDGNPVEATVRIIRGYQEGRDYPSGCPSEFLKQVELFNQKRLADKNSLLMLGWFTASWNDLGAYTLRTPYDLLMAEDYVAYDYQELFIDAGPQLVIEVNADGDLVARTGEESISTLRWSGYNAHYKGYCPDPDSFQIPQNFFDFPIKISDDKKTMTISPDGNYYLNLIGNDQWGGNTAPVIIKSDIILKKK